MHEPTYRAVAEVFKALMHPERLAILDMLRDSERCVCEIERTLGQRQAYVSQQLSVLRNASLVASRRDGGRVMYRIAAPEIFDAIAMARAVLRREPRAGADFELSVEEQRCSM